MLVAGRRCLVSSDGQLFSLATNQLFARPLALRSLARSLLTTQLAWRMDRVQYTWTRSPGQSI